MSKRCLRAGGRGTHGGLLDVKNLRLGENTSEVGSTVHDLDAETRSRDPTVGRRPNGDVPLISVDQGEQDLVLRKQGRVLNYEAM